MFERYLRTLGILLAPQIDSGGGDLDDAAEVAQDLADLEGGPNDDDEDEAGGERRAQEDRQEPPRREDRPRSEKKKDEEGAEGEGEENEEGQEEDAEDDEGEEEERSEEREEEEEEPSESRPTELSYKAIKAKYPQLFKEFPQLRAAMFLAPKFQEHFPDPESAKVAADKAAEYDELEANIVGKGDPASFLQTLSENNPKALTRMVENFPEALRKVSADDYLKLATPILEEALHLAARHGHKIGGKQGNNLLLSARHLANYLFANGGEIPVPRSAQPKEPSEAEKQLETERRQYQERENGRAMKEIYEAISPELNRILGKKLDGLSDFERKAIIKEARSAVDQALAGDKSFQNQMAALWKRAAESGYSDESKSRIRKAWLERARIVAPSVRNRLRQEALDARQPNRGASQDNDQKKRTFPTKGGGSGQSRSGVLDNPKKIDWNKTSDLDILSR